MRTIMIAMILAAMICAVSGCRNEDPLDSGGEQTICDTDPSVAITFPDPEAIWRLTSIVDFEWENDTPCDILMTRYLIMPIAYDYDILADLNENPESFKRLWSRWMPFDWSGGHSVRLESELNPGDPGCSPPSMHFFAVQARARDGNVTEEFIDGRNAVVFDCRYRWDGPRFMISEDNFLGDLAPYTSFLYFPYIVPVSPLFELPGGCPYKFSFEGDAEFYGRRVAGFRSGWDVPDPKNWDEPYSEVNETPEVMFESGEHRLTVEVIDDIGLVSSVTFQFNIIPMTMERDLLWVDDFPSTNDPNPARTTPTEDEHDLFWQGICSRAAGFDPDTDIYDVMENGGEPPSIGLLARYKNIIWTYSSMTSNNAWKEILSRSRTDSKMNYLPMYMSCGGHVWTLGRSSGTYGGIKAVLPDYAYMPESVVCPIQPPFSIDPMPFRDYGITVVDCVYGPFRTGDPMPVRSINIDALRYAYMDESDPVSLAHPAMPQNLELWREITCPTCFFDPSVRGFSYVEVYDPAYWMDVIALAAQPHFHPMYRMKARSSLSPLDHQTIAVWVTKYQDVVPKVASGPAIAAPSVHMGFPLWFFDHDSANRIADVIFGEWGIGQ